MVDANGSVSTGVDVVHFRVKLGRRAPLGPAAIRVHHHAYRRRISKGTMLDMASVRVQIVPFDKLLDQVLAQWPLIVDFFDQFGIADGHSFVDRARDLPQFDF